MLAPVIMLGLLIAGILASPGLPRRPPPFFDSDAFQLTDPTVTEQVDDTAPELYHLRQLQALRDRMNGKQFQKRFFCNRYGCI
uniref:Metalloproteinase inhibitor 1 n=1 Tax=Mesocestoides corti TaxID=53468 RepID=A0A5K3EMS6_MESCO